LQTCTSAAFVCGFAACSFQALGHVSIEFLKVACACAGTLPLRCGRAAREALEARARDLGRPRVRSCELSSCVSRRGVKRKTVGGRAFRGARPDDARRAAIRETRELLAASTP
jgi:hypothetical protein